LLTRLEELTLKYHKKLDSFAILRPFRVDTEQLELLEPIERIEIEVINQIRPKKKEEMLHLNLFKRQDNLYKFTLLMDINNRLSSNDKLFKDEDYLMKVVSEWMNIFLWYFEAGYYEDSDILEVLRRVKENFKLFNEINIPEFVRWYSNYALTFIKAALFKIQCKLIKESMKYKRKFKSKLIKYWGKEENEEEASLSFGKTLVFYKDFHKSHFREMEEEINLLQEIYFNSTFGPNQLKINYMINWELQQSEIELQEYFFNIKDNFMSLQHVVSSTSINTKIPEDIQDKLSEIEKEFLEILAPSHTSALKLGNFISSHVPKSSGRHHDENTPFMSPEQLKVNVPKPDIGMTPKQVADILLGKKADVEGFSNALDHPFKQNQPELHHSDSIYSLFVSIPKLTSILKAINELITREDLQTFRTYIEIRTGSIIEKAAEIIKLKHERGMSASMNADEWEDFKLALSDIIFDSRIYLSMFSRNKICYLVEIMPEQSIKELVKATIDWKMTKVQEMGELIDVTKIHKDDKVHQAMASSRPYKQCFYKLVKAYYRWMIKSTQDFDHRSENEKENFYIHATSILKFFDRMILYIRNTDPTLIQPEIIYFDFLFAMYQYSKAGTLLRNYAHCSDKSPKLESSFNNLFVRMKTKPATFLPASIHKDSSTDLKVDFIYLMALLSSMKLATNRFFTTEHSLLMQTRIDSFVGDLLGFSKGEETSHQDSKDHGTALIKDDKFDFGDGYLNLVFNEKQIQRDKEIQNFLSDAKANDRMENKYFYMLYNMVVRLQTNLLFNTDENLLNNKSISHHMVNTSGKFDIAWRPSEEKLIELCQSNLSPILSDCFLSKKNNKDEHNVFNTSLKAVIHQILNLVKKFELTSFNLDEKNTTELEKMKSFTKRLHDFKGIFDQVAIQIASVQQSRLDEIETDLPTLVGKHKNNYQNMIERIFQVLQDVCNVEGLDLGFNPTDYRRESLHSDLGNLQMLSMLTKHSKKFNPDASDSSEAYYKAILAGRVEMEIDAKELNMGLARSFIKVFNKMLLNQPNYKRRFRKISNDIDNQVRTTFPFVFTDELKRVKENIAELLEEKAALTNEKQKLIEEKQPTTSVDDTLSRIEQSIYRLEERAKKLSLPIDNCHQFLLAYETNYFYNEYYTRAIIIYDKLIDEIPELKSNIYNESYKNKGLINFEMPEGAKFERTYPYLHNLYTLSLQYTYHLMTSVVYNAKWGISFSRLFIVLSVMTNLTLDNYQAFKELFANVRFEDTQGELFKELDEEREKSGKVQTIEKSPANRHTKAGSQKGEIEADKEVIKGLNPFAEEFESDKKSFLVSICCRIERFMNVGNFYDKSNLNLCFDSKINTTSLPLLTIWLNFIDAALLTEKTELMNETTKYVYHKLFTRYLLRMLFNHEDISRMDVMYMKRSICSLLFKLLKNDEVTDDLLKYHSDMRSIYDYTIKITKVHIASLVSNNPTEKMFKWLKRKEKNKKESNISKDKSVDDLILKIATGIKGIAFKKTRSKFSFNPLKLSSSNDDEKKRERLIKYNTDLFGGFNFSEISDRDQQKELEKMIDFSQREIMECYKKSDNRDLGFQFINSLVKLMGYIEYSTGLKLWSSKKETARVQFEVEPTKLPKIKLYELSIVYFLSMINKQIEVVDKDGKNVLINFRKYPEIYTLESLNPLELISEFKFEDFKRDVCKIIPELYVKTNIQYNIQQKMGFWYLFLKSDTTKRHPVFLWLFSVVLNLVIIAGNVNPKYQDDTHEYRSLGYAVTENVLALISMCLSGALLVMMGYTRYLALKISRKTLRNSSISQVKKNNDIFKAALGKIQRILNFFLDNPYYTFIRNLLLEPIAFQVFLHFTFTVLGFSVHKLFYSFGLLMFIFFSKTTRHVLKSISTNSDEIIIAVIIVVLMAYILTIIQFFYFYDTFKSDIFGVMAKPCDTLYHCFMTTVNFGLRFGGGIGENTTYIPETSAGFEAMIVFDLVFFFFINIIGLNMVFGIIIDTFGELRDIEQEKEEVLATKCLICAIDKTTFESVGINFAYHVKVQHNIEDFVAYLIRLNINKRNLVHEIDYYIYENYLRQNVSWFPNHSTIFKDMVTKQLKEMEEKKQKDQEQFILSKIETLDNNIKKIEESFEKIEKYVLKYEDVFTPTSPQGEVPPGEGTRGNGGGFFNGNFFGLNNRLTRVEDNPTN
jgi:hypothetical protein